VVNQRGWVRHAQLGGVILRGVHHHVPSPRGGVSDSDGVSLSIGVCRWSVPGALLMRTQPGQLGVGGLADEALVRSLSGVEAHVVPQSRRLAEASVAEAADEGFVQRVNPHVRAEVAAGVEPAMTDYTTHATNTDGGGGRGGGRAGGGRGGGAFTGVELIWRRKRRDYRAVQGCGISVVDPEGSISLVQWDFSI